MSLTAKIPVNVDIYQTKTYNFGSFAIKSKLGQNFTDGSGADQMDTIWADNRTLANGANETLDLHDGSLKDAFGDSFTLNKLKILYIKNNSEDANLLVGGAASNQLDLFSDTSDIKKIRPGGFMLEIAPDDNGIDTSTDAKLKIAHDGAGTSSLVYDIIAAGVD